MYTDYEVSDSVMEQEMERLTEYDAIVIGSGASGLTAAVTLAEGGARVAVFEKQPAIGGTSINFRGATYIQTYYVPEYVEQTMKIK